MSLAEKQQPSLTTRLSWLGARAFVALGVLLALGAVAYPVWWLAQPEEAPVETVATPETPVLLPETPLVEELPEPERARAAAPRPLPPAFEIAPPVEVVQPPERLVIPAIDLDTPVVPVGWETIQVGEETIGQWRVPNEKSAGWHDTSAGLGGGSNTVLNGHHNLYGQVFGLLVALEVGDTLSLWSGEDKFDYVVTETAVLPEKGQPIEVRLANAEHILPTKDERVTLVTCWPYSSNTHRLVVVAKPAPAFEPFYGGTPYGW